MEDGDTRGTMDVDMTQEGIQNNSLTTTTSVQMESDPIEEVGSVGVSKVYTPEMSLQLRWRVFQDLYLLLGSLPKNVA